MANRILFSLLIITLFTSCSSSGKVTNEPVGQRLIFGNGGGFTGIYITYELCEDGSLFAINPGETKHLVKKLRKKQTREIFDKAGRIKKSQPTFDHPGNMTWFIKYQAGGTVAEYKWGDSNAFVPSEIKEFYNQLNTIVK
jgi:hypothetical protein